MVRSTLTHTVFLVRVLQGQDQSQDRCRVVDSEFLVRVRVGSKGGLRADCVRYAALLCSSLGFRDVRPKLRVRPRVGLVWVGLG